MKKNILCLLINILMVSCSTYQITETTVITPGSRKYVGNTYKKMVGETENIILQKMNAPDRETSDGNGGKILIYEDIKLITNSSSSSRIYGSTNTYVNVSSIGNSVGISSYEKKFINFFIDNNGICYNVKTNIGDQYETIPGTYQDCTYKIRDMDDSWYWMWLLGPIPGIIVSIIDLCTHCYGKRLISCGEPY